MKQDIAQQFEEACNSDGIKAGIEYLERLKKDLDGLSTDVGNMIKAAQKVAVKQGVAAYVEDAPKELAPTKEEFIRLFGQQVFDKVKRYSKPKVIFTWLIQPTSH